MNRIPTRSGGFISENLRLNGLILALALGLTTLPAMANISNSTNGRIHGRAPDVTGKPIILMPDGTTPVTNNAQVLWTAKTADFKLAPISSYVTYVDADGDLPQGVGYTIPPSGGVAWAWTTSGGTILNASQLSQPFQNNFADGTVLKVTVAQDVNVASVSGMPNARQRTLHSGTFDVVVRQPPPPPRVYVNGTTFAIDAGFPKTGFVGANFQFYMNGTSGAANSNYTYATNQPSWTTVSSTGVVAFTQMPTAAQKSVTITITDTTGVDVPRAYTFTPNLWFVNRGTTIGSAAQADAYCAGLGSGYATPSYLMITNAPMAGPGTRAPDGRLWDEWGRMDSFGSGWVGSTYWALEIFVSGRYGVVLANGYLSGYYANNYQACSRSL